MEKLGEDPFPPNTLKLEGAKNLYRIRLGDYRLIYEVDRREKRGHNHVRHRREVYRKL